MDSHELDLIVVGEKVALGPLRCVEENIERGAKREPKVVEERRGQGLGTEATRLVLDFAFHVLHLRNVLLETLEWTAAWLSAYERAGCRRVGVGAVMSQGRPTTL